MFNSKAIKKMKKHGMEEMEPKEKFETSETQELYSSDIPKAMKVKHGELIGAEKLIPKSFGTITSSYKEPKKMKSKEDMAMIEAKMQSAKKPKAIVIKEEEKEEDEMEKKPTKFIPHGGSYLQYLKAKKK
jgi:hypothetical protein